MEGAKPPEVFPHLAKGNGISDEFDDIKPFLDFPDGFVLAHSDTSRLGEAEGGRTAPLGDVRISGSCEN